MMFAEFSVSELLGPLNEVERKHSPEKLYLAGDADLLRRGSRVSIVGSRRASRDGLRRAARLARALVGRDMTVVSGLAKGIDTMAHKAAIEAGGRTIAVLGNPLNQVYPEQNRALQSRIMREHLAVSQFPPGHPLRPSNWPMRNRTMALLTDATVIVEAGDTSGTLHQGWEALRLGRLLFLLESVTRTPGLSWPAEMMKYGAEVLSDENLSLILEEMPERVTAYGLPF